MDFIQVLVLALVQGLTEFLPVSSSAHLIFAPLLLNWNDQGLAFDVAVHVGTLAAVVLYFRKEVVELLFAWFGSFTGTHNPHSRLAWQVLVATLPALPAGLLANQFEDELRGPVIIAWATIGFGLLLLLAQWVYTRSQRELLNEYQMTWLIIILIGLAQCLALIPGTSRSGITITAGLFLGLTAVASARFSFLLSIPIITMAGTLKGVEWATAETLETGSHLLWGALLSAASAGLCIHLFLKLLDRIGMLPFVIYRLVLGVTLLLALS
ncbi:MAG: undecaprenyl-diphosphatase [Gammaproteobacteria bacterium]